MSGGKNPLTLKLSSDHRNYEYLIEYNKAQKRYSKCLTGVTGISIYNDALYIYWKKKATLLRMIYINAYN